MNGGFAIVFADNLSLYYSKTESLILDNVSVIFPVGCITVLLGKSGSGKTTLLRCIGGLEKHVVGSIFIDGKELSRMTASQRASNIGIVFQGFNLFPHLTVLQNCIQPIMINRNIYEGQAVVEALAYLKMVDMDKFASRYPRELSGGQQQRVAVARALSLKPRALLLDEPTSALDPIMKKAFQGLFQQLANKGLAIIISSHDMEFIRCILNRAYLIHQGRVVDYFDNRNKQHKQLNMNSKIHCFLESKSNII